MKTHPLLRVGRGAGRKSSEGDKRVLMDWTALTMGR